MRERKMAAYQKPTGKPDRSMAYLLASSAPMAIKHFAYSCIEGICTLEE